jgi:hypothetical protein
LRMAGSQIAASSMLSTECTVLEQVSSIGPLVYKSFENLYS